MIYHVTSVHPRTDQRIRKYVASIGETFPSVTLLVNDLLTKEKYDKYNIKSLNAKFKSRLISAVIFSLKLVLYSITKKKSIFHLHDPELIPAGVILTLLKHRVVFDVHEDYLAQAKVRYSSRTKQQIYRIFMFILFYSTRYFAALAHATPYILSNYNRFNKKNILVPNYVLMSECILNSELLTFSRCSKSVDQEKEDLTLCYIGGLEDIRSIHELVEALEFFQGRVRCKLAGTFTTLKYENAVRNSVGWKYVDYFGQVDRNLMSEIMCSSDYGIILFKDNENNRNSLPNKIFEYQSAGLGVIHSSFTHWTEYLSHNHKTIGVDIIRSESIVGALQHALSIGGNDNKERIELINHIMDNYSWERYITTLKVLYCTILRK